MIERNKEDEKMLSIIGYTIGYLIGALIGATLANLIIERQETKKIQKEIKCILDFTLPQPDYCGAVIQVNS